MRRSRRRSADRVPLSTLPLRAVIVTNIPAPYRIPVYELLDDHATIDLYVIYTAEREQNRHWSLPPTPVRSSTLRSYVLPWRGRYIHFTRGVVAALRRVSPDVIVTTGFNPPQLLAVAYARVRRLPHVAQTDGTISSEEGLTRVHRLARRWVARNTAAFVAASPEGIRLQRGYGATGRPTFLSPLSIDNEGFALPPLERDIDVLFAGQLSTVKDPLFALQVTAAAAATLGRRLRLVFIGAGPLQEQLQNAARAQRQHVVVEFPGFQQQDQLPHWYARSKVFLFPTRWDPWGLVANEAAAAGIPQIISPNAGAANQLIRDGVSGFVVDRDPASWTARLVELLEDEGLRQSMGAAARANVQSYSFKAAALGLNDAIRAAAASTAH